MSKEQITPAIKPIPSGGGFKEGGKILTTPGDNQGHVWNLDKEQKNKIFGK